MDNTGNVHTSKKYMKTKLLPLPRQINNVSLWRSESEQREHDRTHDQGDPQEYPGQLDLGKVSIVDVNFVGLSSVVDPDPHLHFRKTTTDNVEDSNTQPQTPPPRPSYARHNNHTETPPLHPRVCRNQVQIIANQLFSV